MELTQEEQQWRDELQKRILEFPFDGDHQKQTNALTEMRDIAVTLHNSLKNNGFEPKHHAYMIANRGKQPDDPEFYFHFHPIEDLVKFTFNPHANDDPIDQTIDGEFAFRVFTRRWGHDDIYRIKRTANGWFFTANMYTGPCDKSCSPVLYECLRHDSVLYPVDVGEWFEWLWQQAKRRGLSHDDVQHGLDDIAGWIRLTEQSVPVGEIWEGLA
jgi:hypothetical protein